MTQLSLSDYQLRVKIAPAAGNSNGQKHVVIPEFSAGKYQGSHATGRCHIKHGMTSFLYHFPMQACNDL